MATPAQRQGHPITVTLNGAEELPIVLANAFAVQASGDGAFIITLAQAAPPIFGGDPQEQQRQLLQVTTIPGRILARVVVTAEKLTEFRDLLDGTLKVHEAAIKENIDGASNDSVVQQQANSPGEALSSR